VLIREYKESDLDALRRMHANQGFGYPFPDIADPIFVSKLVVQDDSGRAVMASLARLTCEMYLLLDRDVPDAGSATGGAAKNLPSGDENPSRILRFAQNDVPVCDRGAAARARYDCLLALHAAGERDLFARGLDDAHAWLPPPVARRFGRRLEALGWVRDDTWTPYCRRFKPAATGK
jgi:hypothetical protein